MHKVFKTDSCCGLCARALLDIRVLIAINSPTHRLASQLTDSEEHCVYETSGRHVRNALATLLLTLAASGEKRLQGGPKKVSCTFVIITLEKHTRFL